MDYEDEFWEPEPEAAERRDPVVAAAASAISEMFHAEPERVCYVRQLEILLEKRFFHWVTDFAIRDLTASHFLVDEYASLKKGDARVRFLFRKGHRFRKRQIKRAVQLVERYSEPHFAKACGLYAQDLFLSALMKRGFRLESENTNEFGGRRWAETGNDLDFVISRDGLVYGCEVKNRLEYISREELSIKLKMCSFLGVRPLFIMRMAPKTYNFEIAQSGGYAWIYEAQIYPPGHEALAAEVLSSLGIPVVCSYAIPAGMIDRFLRWHDRR